MTVASVGRRARLVRGSVVVLMIALSLAACRRSATPTYQVGPPVALSGEPLLFDVKDSCSEAQGRWFARADGNKDGFVDLGEAKADARRFFAAVDKDGNGFITPTELTDYRTKAYPPEYRAALSVPMPPANAPQKTPGGTEIQDPEMRRYLMTPITTDLVMSADQDLDFRLTVDEMLAKVTERGARLDADGDGKLSPAEVKAYCGT
ncbi:EF hand domain-containing protein [Zavarzinia compransoris]|nr:EF hand domain-containing protein [Zavarzinia compransoris]